MGYWMVASCLKWKKVTYWHLVEYWVLINIGSNKGPYMWCCCYGYIYVVLSLSEYVVKTFIWFHYQREACSNYGLCFLLLGSHAILTFPFHVKLLSLHNCFHISHILLNNRYLFDNVNILPITRYMKRLR